MNNIQKQQILIWWVLWAAFLVGIFVMYHFLTAQTHQPTPDSSSSWYLAATPFWVSVVVRWVVLPRLKYIRAALPFFVLGIAFAETTMFLGIFIFPSHRFELLILSAAGIFQFMPYFAGRYSIDATSTSQ